MKRKKSFWMIIAAVITLVTIASIGIAVAADINKTKPQAADPQGSPTYLAEETVKKLALNHAGITEADVTELKVVLDYDDGRAEYEVKFRKDNVKYEYEIDAIAGTILSYDAESKKVVQQNNTDTTEPTTYITEDAAKATVLTHAGVAEADVTFTKVKLDYDDGKAEYEVDFYTDTTEYDYEVDAINGTILNIDTEPRKSITSTPSGNSAPAPTATPTYISQQEAKEIALSHAGLAEGDIARLKIKLDYDDGKAEYEIDFRVGQIEYEYEINAITGSIICFEKDIDD